MLDSTSKIPNNDKNSKLPSRLVPSSKPSSSKISAKEKKIRRKREKNLIGSSSARSSGKEDGWLGDARAGSVPFEGARARILLGLKLIPNEGMGDCAGATVVEGEDARTCS